MVLVGALVFALTGWGTGKGSRTYEIDFPDVTGVRIHSQVRYAGAPAGAVTAMRMLAADERSAAPEEQRRNAVRVTVALADSVPPIPADTKISLSSDTLLSEKFVAFSAGSATAPKLANGALLQGSGGSGLDGVFEKVGLLVDSLDPQLRAVEMTLKQFDPLLAKTGEAVDTLKDGMAEALPRISKLADTLTSTASSADTALKRIDKLIEESDGPIKTDLEKLKVALEGVRKSFPSRVDQ